MLALLDGAAIIVGAALVVLLSVATEVEAARGSEVEDMLAIDDDEGVVSDASD